MASEPGTYLVFGLMAMGGPLIISLEQESNPM